MGVSNNFVIISLLSILYNNVEVAEIRSYNGNIATYDTFSLQNATSILNTSYYNYNEITVIMTHGYGESADDPSVTTLVIAYIPKGVNVWALDWRNEASNQFKEIEYPLAVARAMGVGAELHETLISLSDAGMDMNKTWLIGHSLGAPLFGKAGRDLPKPVRSCIGLDPAGPLFEGVLSFEGMDTTCGQKVMIVHTNPGRLGTNKNTGTVDVRVNCGNPTQPGCTGGLAFYFPSEQNMCSHNRSYELLAEAVTYPNTVIARSAPDCPAWEAGGGSQTISIEQELTNTTTGTYYVQTNSQAPYGRGPAGSRYQN